MKQAQTLVHTSTLYATPPLGDLAEAMAQALPGDLNRLFLTNSGSEADETAILLARVHTGLQEIVVLRYGYSGRTMMAMASSGQAPWRKLPQPVPGFVHALAPYCYRCPLKLTYPSCEVACAKDVKEVIETATTGRVAGIMVEVIMGSGGFLVPPKEYFPMVADIVRKAGGVFIADEVQTGFGRTGKLFAIEHYDVEPDLITIAKSVAAGLPLSGVLGRAEFMDAPGASAIGGTYVGNPVAQAAGLAVLDVIDEEGVVERAAAVGETIRGRMLGWQERHEEVGDVRGLGAMLAIELVHDRESKDPAPELVTAVCEHAFRGGLLLLGAGIYSNVVRVLVPLTIEDAELEEALGVWEQALEHVLAA